MATWCSREALRYANFPLPIGLGIKVEGCAWAEVLQRAFAARRLACGAQGAAVVDEQMANVDPIGLGYDFHEVALDLGGVLLAG